MQSFTRIDFRPYKCCEEHFVFIRKVSRCNCSNKLYVVQNTTIGLLNTAFISRGRKYEIQFAAETFKGERSCDVTAFGN